MIPKTADTNGIIINGFGGILLLELSDLSIGVKKRKEETYNNYTVAGNR